MDVPPKNKRIEKVLRRLAHENRLSAETLVEEARDPSHPLHSAFEWDDSKAAHQYRLNQARRIIRSVRIEVTIEESTYQVPRYVHDEKQPLTQGYAELQKVKRSKRVAVETMKTEIRRMSSILHRTLNISRVLGLEDYVLEAIEIVKKADAELDAYPLEDED